MQGDHYQSFVNGVKTADFNQANDPEGHIGFQELSRGEGHAQIRHARIKVSE